MTEKSSKPKVAALTSIGAICTEMGKVYKSCRHGNLDTIDAARLVAMLTQIRQAVEVGSFEQRLAALEQEDAPAFGRARRAGPGLRR